MEKLKQLFSKLLQNKKLLWIIGGVILALIVVGIVIGVLVGGSGEKPADELTGCTVTVKTEGGLPLADLGVFIYTDAAQAELVTFVKTNENGVAAISEPVPAGSVAVLKDVPAGYDVAENYPITQEDTTIVLPVTLLPEMSDITLGGVMFDFTVTTPDGTAYTLSDLLKEKKAVVLNLWYTGCQPCKAEFPYLQQAYERYGTDIEVLALDPESTDDDASVAAFKTELDLTIPMAKCGEEWKNIISGLAYPTTIVIDRFGTVALIHTGAVDSAKIFEDTFAFFTAEDYVQTTVEKMADLVTEDDEPEQGTAENPFEIGGATEFEVSVEPGETVYYHVYRISGKELQVSSNTLRITCGETVYEPVDGVISFMVTAPDTYTPVSMAFTNTGTAAETYKVTFASQPGSYDSPYTLELGDFTASVAAGNEQGVYYTWTSTGTGTMTVQCLSATEGVKYGYTLYNLNTYAQRTTDSEGTVDEATGVVTLSIAVNTGDVVQLIVSTLPNEENEYPAADFQMNAAFSTEEQGSEGTTGDDTGSGNTGSGNTGSGNAGSGSNGNTGSGNTGSGNTSTGNTGSGNTGSGNTGSGNTGSGNTGSGNTGSDNTGSDNTDSGNTGTYVELYVGNALQVSAGTTTVNITGSDVNYFVFEPTQSGKYSVSVNAGTLSYYGNNTAFIQDLSDTVDCNGTSFSVNIKEGHLGSAYILGIKGSGSVKLTITRTGDAVLDINDMPWTTYTGTTKPTSKYTYSGGSLTKVNITGDTVQIVYGSDGYYHWGSANGPVVYVDLDDDTYLSFSNWLTSDYPVIRAVVQNGSSVTKWDFSSCMSAYNKYKDSGTGVYPMTEDLKFILETLYETQGWGDPDMAYLFGSVTGTLNKDMAWLFCCCYNAA